MNKNETNIIIRSGASALVLALLLLVGFAFIVNAASPVPGSAQVFTAGVTVGGDAPFLPMLIAHIPLRGISPVSKLVIIQGEAGANPSKHLVFFPDRVFPQDDPPPGEGILIRLQYRMIPLDVTDPETVPFSEISLHSFLDPVPFAFQIPLEDITQGDLQYRIIAHRLHSGTTNQAETAAVPSEAMEDSDSWVTVGVKAGANNAFDMSGGRLEVFDGNPNDCETSVDIPVGLLGTTSDIALTEIPVNSGLLPPLDGITQPLKAYRMDAGQRISGSLLVNVLYPDFVFPQGKDGILDGTSYPVSMAGIAYWNGKKWQRLGGRNDNAVNCLSARIGPFEYLVVIPMAPLTAEDRRTLARIITPNDDGENDAADFRFADPTQNLTIEIFDVNGHRVRSIRGAGGDLKWNGRDDSGKIVESGVYIYQYEFEGTRVSGLIAVAK